MKKNLLLVDDDQDLRESIANYLVSQGFSVVSSKSVQEALEILQSCHIDLVITDIMMPELDGYDLIKLLRFDSRLSSIPIIFVTAKGMTIDRIKGYDLGCNSYLPKPFDPDELVSIARSLLKNLDSISKSDLVNADDTQNELSGSIFTPKERVIFKLVYQGSTNKEISAELSLKVRTVEKYVSRLLAKTNSRNRTQLVKFAVINNLFDNKANDGNRTRE